MQSLFGRLRRKVRLTEQDVDDALREIRAILLEADVSLPVVKDLSTALREELVGAQVWETLEASDIILSKVYEQLVRLLGKGEERIRWSSSPPTVILLLGLQGSGKTTTAAKLAAHLKKEGKKPLLLACDLRRPAAVRQLEALGEAVGVPVHTPERLSTPNLMDLADSALQACRDYFYDVLIADTAGRLQLDSEQMKEAKQLKERLSAHEVFLVLDSTTGQQALNVAQTFHEQVPLTGLIFTKTDADARGGAVLSARVATGVPVRFVGSGETPADLEPFDGPRFAQRILGLGDIEALVTKVQEVVDVSKVSEIKKKAPKGQLDFNDLLEQIEGIKKMGPLRSVLRLIPGLPTIDESLEEQGAQQMKKFEAIILSMTREERENPDIMNASRKRRIAAGSGTTVQDVNQLLRQMEVLRVHAKALLGGFAGRRRRNGKKRR
jgi:signal recognition particle subunit SRP54